jgi:glycosyltransferase involved in cell wall biosynthesis
MRVAFAIENHLGHRAVAANLQAAIADVRDLDPVWIPIDAYGNGIIDHIPRIKDKHALVLALSARRGLREAAKQGTIDIAFLHTQRMAHLLVGFMRRPPSFLSVDATPVALEQYLALQGKASQQGSRYWAIRDAVHRRTYAAARGVVCMSEVVQRTLVEQYEVPKQRTLVLWPALDLNQWRPPAVRPSEGDVRLLFVGGDFDRKGGPQLLRWAKETRTRGYTLDIVTEQAIEVPAHVRLHSNLKPNDPRLMQLVRDADLLVLPTRADMSPWVVTEAKASGKAVLATTVGALPEMVRDGVDGWLIAPDDFSALSQRLDHAIQNRAILAEFGVKAREDAESRFNSQRNAELLLDFMRSKR